jgi:hypothetical protein
MAPNTTNRRQQISDCVARQAPEQHLWMIATMLKAQKKRGKGGERKNG